MSKAKAEIGHNSDNFSQGKLKSYISKIEKLEEDKDAILTDIKDVYAETKSEGFDNKAIRQVVRLRKLDRQKRTEQQELIELYLSVMGDL